MLRDENGVMFRNELIEIVAHFHALLTPYIHTNASRAIWLSILVCACSC